MEYDVYISLLVYHERWWWWCSRRKYKFIIEHHKLFIHHDIDEVKNDGKIQKEKKTK